MNYFLFWLAGVFVGIGVGSIICFVIEKRNEADAMVEAEKWRAHYSTLFDRLLNRERIRSDTTIKTMRRMDEKYRKSFNILINHVDLKSKRDCRKCKKFVFCDPYKMIFYKTSGEDCDEYEEGKTNEDISD